VDALLVESLIKLGMSILVGGLIGAEREFRVKAAGFRTIILITVGSTLFTIFSISIDPEHNRTAIAGNIVQGIGFLGAGAIIRDGGRIGAYHRRDDLAAAGMGIGAAVQLRPHRGRRCAGDPVVIPTPGALDPPH
jgi:putative Mg2+ transporter-C (MgtC) family protein